MVALSLFQRSKYFSFSLINVIEYLYKTYCKHVYCSTMSWLSYTLLLQYASPPQTMKNVWSNLFILHEICQCIKRLLSALCGNRGDLAVKADIQMTTITTKQALKMIGHLSVCLFFLPPKEALVSHHKFTNMIKKSSQDLQSVKRVNNWSLISKQLKAFVFSRALFVAALYLTKHSF